MKYVFYDAESVDNKHRYSFTFGYVVTDEKFKIISPKQDIIFNSDLPKNEWDWWAYRHLLKDSYSEKDITTAKPFTKYYDKIKKLFNSKDEVLCIGFEIEEDVKYLINNCLRYNLPSINFKYIDIRRIIKYLTKNKPNSLAIEYTKCSQKLANDAHTSDVDAEMTMVVLSSLLKNNKIDLQTILKDNPNFIGTVNEYCYGYGENIIDIRAPKEKKYEGHGKNRVRILKEGQEDWILKGTKNDIMFIRFLDHVKPNQSCEQIFKDKKISFSLNYEGYNFTNMIKLVQLITNAGGTYVKKASLSDIFVKAHNCFDDDGNIKRCSKFEYVNEAISTGTKIEIMEFNDFLKLLNLDIEQLNELPPIDLTYLENEKYAR